MRSTVVSCAVAIAVCGFAAASSSIAATESRSVGEATEVAEPIPVADTPGAYEASQKRLLEELGIDSWETLVTRQQLVDQIVEQVEPVLRQAGVWATFAVQYDPLRVSFPVSSSKVAQAAITRAGIKLTDAAELVEIGKNEAEIVAQMGETITDFRASAGKRAASSIGFDARTQTIEMRVTPAAAASAAEWEARRQDRSSDLPVSLTVAALEDDAICVSREFCVNPMEAGSVIRKGGTGGGRCTLGTLVENTNNGDIQGLTAGHCGHTGADDWYHRGLPNPQRVGFEVNTLYEPANNCSTNFLAWIVTCPIDTMRVGVPDMQSSDNVYNHSNVNWMRSPGSGESVCTSLGVSNAVYCSVVTDSLQLHFSGTANIDVLSARFTAVPLYMNGDSGAPVMTVTTTALGILNTRQGSFSRGGDILFRWSFITWVD